MSPTEALALPWPRLEDHTSTLPLRALHGRVRARAHQPRAPGPRSCAVALPLQAKGEERELQMLRCVLVKWEAATARVWVVVECVADFGRNN